MTYPPASYHMRILRGGYAPPGSGQLGAGTMGSGTLGERATQAAVEGINYVVIPVSGSYPSEPAWSFRRGDTGRTFECTMVDSRNPTERLATADIATAELILTDISARDHWTRLYPLDLDSVNDICFRQWHEYDLPLIGRFMVMVKLIFNSGRQMTLQANDQTQVFVYDQALAGDPV